MTGIHWLVLDPTHQIFIRYLLYASHFSTKSETKKFDNYKTDDQKKCNGFSVYKKKYEVKIPPNNNNNNNNRVTLSSKMVFFLSSSPTAEGREGRDLN